MKKPILVPGHLGDLLQIFDYARAEVLIVKQALDPAAKDRLPLIAKAARDSLNMWLGLEPVAEEEESV